MRQPPPQQVVLHRFIDLMNIHKICEQQGTAKPGTVNENADVQKGDEWWTALGRERETFITSIWPTQRTLAVDAITISPVQNVTPPPCPVASSIQLQPATAQATPALRLLLGKIIINVDAVPSQAVAMMEQSMLGPPSR